MALNQTTLRGILAQILSVDEKYIVPKQGNWYNPQEANPNIETWCAYRVKSNRPRTTPFYKDSEKNVNNAVQNYNSVNVLKIADIDLQFVGAKSEELANSVSFWNLRGDVKSAFAAVQGSVLYDEKTAISSDFYQDGNNTIVAWNTSIRVLWYDSMETNQSKITQVII